MTTDRTTVSFAQGTAPVSDTAVFEIYIKAGPEKIWDAITDPSQRAKYSFGVQTHSDWTTGSSYRAGMPGVVDIAEGENVLVEPPRLLVQTFNALIQRVQTSLEEQQRFLADTSHELRSPLTVSGRTSDFSGVTPIRTPARSVCARPRPKRPG